MTIIKHDNGDNYYFIIKLNKHNTLISAINVSKALGLTLKEYLDKAIACGGRLILGNIYFEREQELDKFLEELDPYLVMLELRGD